MQLKRLNAFGKRKNITKNNKYHIYRIGKQTEEEATLFCTNKMSIKGKLIAKINFSSQNYRNLDSQKL